MDLTDVESYPQLRAILKGSSWRRFEEIVGRIFELHDYDVAVSRVISFGNEKRQYDVIAEKDCFVLADCKKWDNKRRIEYGLERAVENQIERVKRLTVDGSKFPLVVLSCNTPVEHYMGVPIVSIQKLNSFLSNFQINRQEILKIN